MHTASLAPTLRSVFRLPPPIPSPSASALLCEWVFPSSMLDLREHVLDHL
jgi:hypothetical protein